MISVSPIFYDRIRSGAPATVLYSGFGPAEAVNTSQDEVNFDASGVDRHQSKCTAPGRRVTTIMIDALRAGVRGSRSWSSIRTAGRTSPPR